MEGVIYQYLSVNFLNMSISDPACNNVTNYYDPSSRSSSPLNLVKISVTQDEPSTSNEILEVICKLGLLIHIVILFQRFFIFIFFI